MSPLDWAMRPLKRYADFSGRSPRAEYWWFYLGYMILGFVLQLLVNVSAIFGLLGLVYLALIIPMLAVGVRRLHDTDRTGWWLLAPLLPYLIGFALVGSALFSGPEGLAQSGSFGTAMIFFGLGFVLSIVVFVFTVLPGTKGENSYGPDPYGPQNLDEVFA